MASCSDKTFLNNSVLRATCTRSFLSSFLCAAWARPMAVYTVVRIWRPLNDLDSALFVNPTPSTSSNPGCDLWPGAGLRKSRNIFSLSSSCSSSYSMAISGRAEGQQLPTYMLGRTCSKTLEYQHWAGADASADASPRRPPAHPPPPPPPPPSPRPARRR